MITIDYIEENVLEWTDRYLQESVSIKYPSSFKQASFTKSSETSNQITEELKDKLLKIFEENLPVEQISRLETYTQISVQKYEIGDYIPPHVDNYQWNCVLCLSDDPVNGVVLWNDIENKFIFHEDIYGSILEVPSDTYHWISPIRNQTRYTVVLLESNGSEIPIPSDKLYEGESRMVQIVPPAEEMNEENLPPDYRLPDEYFKQDKESSDYTNSETPENIDLGLAYNLDDINHIDEN